MGISKVGKSDERETVDELKQKMRIYKKQRDDLADTAVCQSERMIKLENTVNVLVKALERADVIAFGDKTFIYDALSTAYRVIGDGK
jgi:hypothetical protein